MAVATGLRPVERLAALWAFNLPSPRAGFLVLRFDERAHDREVLEEPINVELERGLFPVSLFLGRVFGSRTNGSCLVRPNARHLTHPSGAVAAAEAVDWVNAGAALPSGRSIEQIAPIVVLAVDEAHSAPPLFPQGSFHSA